MSGLMWVRRAAWSAPSRSKKRCRTSLPWPSAIHTFALSWSTTTVMYLCPLRWLISSMPIRGSPARRSMARSRSATTRSTIAPMVRQEVRIRCAVALLEHSAAIPGGLPVEGMGMTGAVTGPGHRSDGRAVLAAGHPRRRGLQEDAQHPVVEVPPPAPPPPRVVPGCRAPAPATPLPTARIGPYRHDHALFVLVDADAWRRSGADASPSCRPRSWSTPRSGTCAPS